MKLNLGDRRTTKADTDLILLCFYRSFYAVFTCLSTITHIRVKFRTSESQEAIESSKAVVFIISLK